MKNSSAKIWIFLTCLCGTAFAAHAQSFHLDWFTVDGGGNTSAGGNFSLSGTIGQPDASAPLTGGAFSLTGGFWSYFAGSTPDAPRLSIRLTSASNGVVSWPSPSTGFVLQQNSNLNTNSWVNAPQTVSDNGTERFISVSPSSDRRFYRLFKP